MEAPGQPPNLPSPKSGPGNTKPYVSLTIIHSRIRGIVNEAGEECSPGVERSAMVRWGPCYSRSRQCSTTGITKTVICTIMFLRRCI